MVDVINLRQARKQKARDDKARRSETNRARHGRTKAECERDQAAEQKWQKHLDHHLRDQTVQTETASLSVKRTSASDHQAAGGKEPESEDKVVALHPGRDHSGT
jgi:hypothetical protein